MKCPFLVLKFFFLILHIQSSLDIFSGLISRTPHRYQNPQMKKSLVLNDIVFVYFDYVKIFYHNKFWKILIEMVVSDHLTCFLRNMYTGQEATVWIRHGTTDYFEIEKTVWQGCTLSSCLFNLHAECVMQHARLDESQAGIKIARRNINNLRYVDDTTLMEEIKEKLKSFLMRMK